MTTNDDFLTVNELAERFNLHPQTIYRWHSKGRIPSAKFLGKGLRFCYADVLNSFTKKDRDEGDSHKELIECIIDLADSVDDSGKLSKHLDGVPEINDHEYEIDEMKDWIMDSFDAIAEAMCNKLKEKDKRLYQFACMVNDGNNIAFDVAKNIVIEFAHLKEEEEE